MGLWWNKALGEEEAQHCMKDDGTGGRASLRKSVLKGIRNPQSRDPTGMKNVKTSRYWLDQYVDCGSEASVREQTMLLELTSYSDDHYCTVLAGCRLCRTLKLYWSFRSK